MRFTKMATSGEQQPGQGCSNVMLLVLMPAFSLFITFTVPGGVGIYWICSNVIAVAQTILLNQIYNPAKIRAQAEKEYEERRRKKAEDKKRLKGSAYPRGGRSPPPSQRRRPRPPSRPGWRPPTKNRSKRRKIPTN